MLQNHPENKSATINLKDGRILGYADVGDPNGRPVIHFHGTPGCRLDVLFAEDYAAQNSIRFIGVDRPGMGLSSFQHHRKLLDWPDDVVELADALGIQRFAVQGVSGGGPFALACAYKIPERLTACGVIVGMGPHYLSTRGMHFSNRLIFFLSRYFPALTALMLRGSAKRTQDLEKSYAEMMANLDKNFRKHDADALRDPKKMRIFVLGAKEAFRQGTRGIAYEASIFMKPWGFDLKDIQCKHVYLWHGALDTNVPIETARIVAGKIPDCQATFYEEDGHYSLSLNHLNEIINLMASFDQPIELENDMDLKEERNMILDMVSEGKITVEEAKQLLDALEQSVKDDKPDEDFFTVPEINFQIPNMPNIPRIVNRATRHAFRHSMRPGAFHNLDELEDVRENLEDAIEEIREQMEELKEQARELREHEAEKHAEEDWDE